mmetsp:Transcript_6716/g.17193  ORF Transcript_6716/g.17193 Transcript_6716/m.17193 type:complete len:196 (+) Transcript_6716:118-705(+)
MLERYNQRGGLEGIMLVIRDEQTGAVLGCVGAQVQTFKGTVPFKRADEGTKGEYTDRPVIANLATAPAARRQGLAKRLMAAVEEECLDWGYEEAVLVVEASNSKALGLYRKLGYKAIGGEAATPNLKVSAEGKVVEATVKTVFMRKSLRGGAAGALDNLDVGAVLGVVVGAAVAAKVITDGGGVDSILAAGASAF